MQADAWYRQLLRSHEMMQQLVGGADPTSPLEADWDTASVTSTEQTDQTEDKPSGWAAGIKCYSGMILQVDGSQQQLDSV